MRSFLYVILSFIAISCHGQCSLTFETNAPRYGDYLNGYEIETTDMWDLTDMQILKRHHKKGYYDFNRYSLTEDA